jgi:hypothetical protein
MKRKQKIKKEASKLKILRRENGQNKLLKKERNKKEKSK